MEVFNLKSVCISCGIHAVQSARVTKPLASLHSATIAAWRWSWKKLTPKLVFHSCSIVMTYIIAATQLHFTWIQAAQGDCNSKFCAATPFVWRIAGHFPGNDCYAPILIMSRWGRGVWYVVSSKTTSFPALSHHTPTVSNLIQHLFYRICNVKLLFRFIFCKVFLLVQSSYDFYMHFLGFACLFFIVL